MASIADCPVPKRSLNARSVSASLTATTGHARRPSASSARSRTSPVVVSSVPPRTPSSSSGRVACSAVSRSAPSSSVMRGARSTTAATPAAQSSPACTSVPLAASAAATSACVANGFEAHSATAAPPASSTRTRLAVSDVTCRQAPTTRLSSGRSRANRSPIERSTGIWPAAQSIRASPAVLIAPAPVQRRRLRRRRVVLVDAEAAVLAHEGDVELRERPVGRAQVAVVDVVGDEAAVLHRRHDVVQQRRALDQLEERDLEQHDLRGVEDALGALDDRELVALHVGLEHVRPGQPALAHEV